MVKLQENPLGFLPLLLVGGGIATAIGYGAYRAAKKEKEEEAAKEPLPEAVKPMLEPAVTAAVQIERPEEPSEMRVGVCARIPNVELTAQQRAEKPARYKEYERESLLLKAQGAAIPLTGGQQSAAVAAAYMALKLNLQERAKKQELLREKYADAITEYERRIEEAKAEGKRQQEDLFSIFKEKGWRIYPVPWVGDVAHYYYACKPRTLPVEWVNLLKSVVAKDVCVSSTYVPPPVLEELKSMGWKEVTRPQATLDVLRGGPKLPVVCICPPGKELEPTVKPVGVPVSQRQIDYAVVQEMLDTWAASQPVPKGEAKAIAGLFSGLPQLRAAEAINRQFYGRE